MRNGAAELSPKLQSEYVLGIWHEQNETGVDVLKIPHFSLSEDCHLTGFTYTHTLTHMFICYTCCM